MAANRLMRERAVFFCCDIQEIFRHLTLQMPHVIHTASMMSQAADLLGIPLVVTEQYPRALKSTVHEVDISHAFKVEKTRFSMLVPEVTEFLRNVPERRTIALFGIEAHVCVQQTALDLLQEGYSVHLICDGVSSQVRRRPVRT
eukprot:GHVS01086198.1.p1 GENE.GHVS01086198.1~~GHVS01086198.1.p1  ORF type:complete len:144 (-),score=12.59 GHVS01086198.1:722-1153(-)